MLKSNKNKYINLKIWPEFLHYILLHLLLNDPTQIYILKLECHFIFILKTALYFGFCICFIYYSQFFVFILFLPFLLPNCFCYLSLCCWTTQDYSILFWF